MAVYVHVTVLWGLKNKTTTNKNGYIDIYELQELFAFFFGVDCCQTFLSNQSAT